MDNHTSLADMEAQKRHILCEELLKHATDILDKLDSDIDTEWVLNETNKYFQQKGKS